MRRGEIHDFKFRQPRAEARREAGAVLEPARGFNRAAAGEPLGHPGRIAEEGEDPVDRGADVVDERMANGSHSMPLRGLAHPIYGNRRGLPVRRALGHRFSIRWGITVAWLGVSRARARPQSLRGGPYD